MNSQACSVSNICWADPSFDGPALKSPSRGVLSHKTDLGSRSVVMSSLLGIRSPVVSSRVDNPRARGDGITLPYADTRCCPAAIQHRSGCTTREMETRPIVLLMRRSAARSSFLLDTNNAEARGAPSCGGLCVSACDRRTGRRLMNTSLTARMVGDAS